jgi:phage major head subunit gpT-like protein
MELIQSNIDFLWFGFNNIVQQALMSTVTYWATIASQTTSSTRQEVHAWIDRLPLMREWLGERQILNLQTRAYTLINKDYEATVEIDRNPLLDDQFGIFNARAQALGMSGALWPDQLVIAALQNGDTTAATCYDGQPYFNASHPQDPDNAASPVQSNLFTTAGSGARLLTSANFAFVRASMMAWKGANAFPVNTMPDTIYVPPLLDVTARQIVQSAFTSTAVAVGQNAAAAPSSNVLQGMAQVVTIPKLAGDDTTWYMADTKTLGAIVRGIIFQVRQPVQIVQKTSPTDDNVFKTRKFLWGIDARGNAGYTLPFLMAKAGA